MMNRLFAQWLVVGCVGLAALLMASPVEAQSSMGGTPAGVGNDPPMGPFVGSPDTGMIMVGTENNPIEITIDPNADAWIKTFVIPGSITINPGMTFPVWENLLILPPPPTSGIPRLPLTDWHEHIHQVSFDTPFGWAGGHIVIPGPPGTPPIEVPGMVDPTDPSGIWFAFPPLPIPPTGLPISIHKQLVYNGTGPLTPGPEPIVITVWEHPTVPEPSALILAGLSGFALIGLGRRRAQA